MDCGTKTGWAVMKDKKIIESGVQDFSKKRGESNGIMFLQFRHWFKTLLASLGVDRLTLIVYEQAHMRGGAATEICVGLQTRVQEIAAEHGILCAPVHSATLKKYSTGSGRGDKSGMIKRAKEILGREPIDDNEADATCLAVFGVENYL
jgi:Holliday junction resolvasome RuvABC endonuclease subunit